MKQQKFFFLMVALTLLLTACAAPAPVGSTEASPQGSRQEESLPESSAPETEPPLTVIPNLLEPESLFSRERTEAPRFVMIHFTSAVVNNRQNPYELSEIRRIFEEAEVSVHYIIGRDGTVEQWGAEERVSYHAGKGNYQNDPQYTNRMNDYAIGIELCAIGSEADMAPYLTPEEYRALDPSLPGYTDAQYESLRLLVQDICRRYDIPLDREHILGHEDYASQKTDPGELFQWERLLTP